MHKILIALSLICFEPAFAKIFGPDANGNTVEVAAPVTPYTKFHDSFSYDDYQRLSQSDRRMALFDILIVSMDPSRPLDSVKKTHVQNILAQHFYTLPPKVAKEITDSVIWYAAISKDVDLGKNLVKKFASPYPQERAEDFCVIVRVIASVMAGDPKKATAKNFLEASNDTLEPFSEVISAAGPLSDDKCVISKNDTEPLSLKQMVQEIKKKGGRVDAPSVKTGITLPAALKRDCSAAEMRSVFIDAMNKIKENGSKHKVYLGVETMKCPVHGLVVQAPNKEYRFYPNSYREGYVQAIVFNNAEEIVSKIKPPEPPPPPPEPKRTLPVSPFGSTTR